MKKLYYFSLLAMIFARTEAQENHAEMKGLIAKEMKSYQQKMAIGNVNSNTLNYDLQYQRMDVSLDPAVYSIAGSVTSHFKPTQAMSSIYFDLAHTLSVSSVQFHGQNLNFQQLSTKEIKIDFPSALPANTLDSLTINYAGAPPTTYNSFSTTTQSGVPLLSTLSEPYGAQDWFPTKQSLNDKIDRFDIKVTAPSQYNVASNGKLMSETLLPNGKKRTFWRTVYPTAAYLVALGITNYTKSVDVIGNPPFPFINYLYPSTTGNTTSMANIEWTKTVMNTFETYFGLYPFRNEKYGHMEFQFGGGMEHQTMSSMGGWSKQLIAHELAHQWFGDKVTCGAWNDIWLNEGFATFGEHLANEKLLMTNADFMTYLLDQKNYITSSTSGSVYVSDANLGSVGTIFSGRLSYAKGGYVVRMLKWILGDSVFYQAVKDYHARPNLAYNYAKTADLNASLLLSTGKNFTEFFNDWIYGQGYPTYDIRWKQTGNTLIFKASQSQSHPSVAFFEMPLPIKVTGTGGQVAFFALNHTANQQYFTESVPFTVANVQFNYEYQIIEKNSTVTQDASLATSEINKNDFGIYPNPVKELLYIRGLQQNVPIKIISAEGRLVREAVFQTGKPINVQDLVPGLYVLIVNDKSIKFIKE